MEIVFLYVTAPDEAAAERIGAALVEARAAACVNILPRIRSIYRWDGAVERANEAAMIVKTTTAAAGRARAVIGALHPYETPAIAAIPIDASRSAEKFIDWIGGSVLKTLS